MADIPNKPTLDTLFTDADYYGALTARSKDAQIQFALKVLNAAYHGVVDLTKDKYGEGVDDALKITERYVKARQGAVVFDKTAPNQRKTSSCFRKVIEAGGWTRGGTGEPLTTVNNLMNLYQKLRADPANSKLLDDAFNVLMKFSRTLVKRDQLPADDELRLFCFKAQPHLATVEDILTSIHKQVIALENGNAAHNTAQLKTAETAAIRAACTKALADIATSKKPPTKKASNGVTLATTAATV